MSNSQSLKGLSPDATIGQIITAENNAGSLLSSIGLNPENHESETLRSVCQQKKWSEVEVLKWLKKNQQNNSAHNRESEEGLPDFGNDLNKWCRYLEKYFLTKNRKLLNEINSHFPRVHKIHGNQYEWLKNMHWHFQKLEEKLNYYFAFQRHKLFPLLQKLKDSKQNTLHGIITKTENGIHILKEDHNEILDLMKIVTQKGQEFKNPEGACSTLRILNYNLKTLFSSLRKQIKIEQDVLIPLTQKKLESG